MGPDLGVNGVLMKQGVDERGMGGEHFDNVSASKTDSLLQTVWDRRTWGLIRWDCQQPDIVCVHIVRVRVRVRVHTPCACACTCVRAGVYARGMSWALIN